ncbi:MAG: 4-Cys prefix domain-containing protein [Waterburya sp.]
MSYCLNPHCLEPNNEDRQDKCNGCASNLLLNDR